MKNIIQLKCFCCVVYIIYLRNTVNVSKPNVIAEIPVFAKLKEESIHFGYVARGGLSLAFFCMCLNRNQSIFYQKLRF